MLPMSYAEQSYQNDLNSDALRNMVYALQGYTDPGAIGDAMARTPKEAGTIMDYFMRNNAANADAHARATGALANVLGANAGANAQMYGSDVGASNILNQVMGQQSIAAGNNQTDLQKASIMAQQAQRDSITKYLQDMQTTQLKGQQDIAKELYKPSSANAAMQGAIMQTYSELVKKLGDPAKAYQVLQQLVTMPPGMGLQGQTGMVPGMPGMQPQRPVTNPMLNSNGIPPTADPRLQMLLRTSQGA